MEDSKQIIAMMDNLANLCQRQFAAIEERFVGMDKRFDALEARLDRVEARLEGVETRLDGIDARLAELTEEFSVFKSLAAHNSIQIENLKRKVSS